MEHHMSAIVPFPARGPDHVARQERSEPAERPQRPDRAEGPGRSGESVGHRARAMVAEAIEMGHELPANAMGLAASQGKWGAENFFLIMVNVEAPDAEGETTEPVAGSGEPAEVEDAVVLDNDAEVAEPDMAPGGDDLDVAAQEQEPDEAGADLDADLQSLADAALNLYEMTQNILQGYGMNTMETALELLSGDAETDAA